MIPELCDLSVVNMTAVHWEEEAYRKKTWSSETCCWLLFLLPFLSQFKGKNRDNTSNSWREVLNGAKIRLQSARCDTEEAAAVSWGTLRRGRSGWGSNFPINYRTNKLQSRTFMFAAPLPPLSHTSCDSPNHKPWAIREVPVHVRTTFTRKSALPVNRADFLWTAWDLALSQVQTLFLSVCLPPSIPRFSGVSAPEKRLSAPRLMWWNGEVVKSEREDLWLEDNAHDFLFQACRFFLR